MAEYCPKCNYKLRLRDWRPECPNCGVNVVYYGIEDRLREEADAAELEHAKMQPRYDRMKFSLIGHPLSIVRLVIGLLPVVATLLPMGTIAYVLPYAATEKSLNLVAIINYLASGKPDFGLLPDLISSDLIGKGMLLWTLALVSFLIAVLAALVGEILLFLSCSPKGFVRNITLTSIGMVFATVAQITYVMMIKAFSEALPGIFTATAVPWAYIVMMLCFAAIAVVNVIYKKKEIPVKYKDVSEFLLPYNERPSTKEKKARKTAGAKTAAQN